MNARTTVIGTLGAVALLLPSTAAAKPRPRDFAHTYPVASRLCARADAGHLTNKLQPSLAQVQQDCSVLNSSFTQAQTDLQNAVAPLQQQASDAVSSARSACQAARQSRDRGACKTALAGAKATLAGLKSQLKTAAVSYRTAVNAARKAFWSSIRSLRGGASITPDKPFQG